jgi:hypothetical protein
MWMRTRTGKLKTGKTLERAVKLQRAVDASGLSLSDVYDAVVKQHRPIRERTGHNQIFNKEKLRKYLLGGYVRCGCCGNSLSSATYDGFQYHRHNQHAGDAGLSCGFKSVRADMLEEHILSHLYRWKRDEPAFEAAVQQALPSPETRHELANNIRQAKKQRDRAANAIANLVKAIEAGGDPGLLIGRQEELVQDRNAATARLADLELEAAELPDEDFVKQQVGAVRLMLDRMHTGKNWRDQSYTEIRHFLKYLFGDNCRRTGFGIYVSRENDQWKVAFKGRVEFHHELCNGEATPWGWEGYLAKCNKTIEMVLESGLRRADREFELASAAADALKPAAPYRLGVV